MILLSLSSSAFGMVARTDRKNVKMGWESKLKPAWVVDFHTRIIIYWREHEEEKSLGSILKLVKKKPQAYCVFWYKLLCHIF